MKILIFASAALLLGVGAGVGSTMLEFNGVEEKFEPFMSAASTKSSPTETKNRPQVKSLGSNDKMVNSAIVHDFDQMERNTTGNYTFVLKNVGDAPLEMTLIRLTCVCTSTEIEKDETFRIEPGEIKSVPLEWTPKEYSRTFRQSAEFTTNDPQHPNLHLVLEGRVTMSQRPQPNEINFADVPTRESRTAELRVFGFESDDLQYVEHEFSQPESAKYFDLQVEPLPTNDLENEPGAKSGLLLRVVKKAGLPIGPFQQTLELRTSINRDGAAMTIPIRGKVVGDVFFHTTSTFDQAHQVLLLPNIKKGNGHRATLRIGFTGEHKDTVEVSIDPKNVDPQDVLVASFGKAIRSDDGPTIFPLVIEIPPDSPVVSRLGPKRKDFGKIVVDTTHPDAKQIVIYVRFAIEP